MTFPVFPGSNPSGYNLTRSLRFRSSASAYLNRTPASTSGNQIFTASFWIKRGKLDNQGLFYAYLNNNAADGISFQNGALDVAFYLGGASYLLQLVTTQVFRDPAAWYHFVLAVDTTQATASNRAKLYVNGTQITAFSTATYPTQNATFTFNTNCVHTIGATNYSTLANYYDGYLTEINWITGQALTPSSFGSTNTLTGVWQPARYTGTYGTNGFYLPFTDNSALTTSSNVGLGKDFSGNGNYWTTNNISITAGVTYDSMTDVPTLTSATAANFAVLNPLWNNSSVSLSNGNLTATGTGYYPAIATIGVTSGKWYWEYIAQTSPNTVGLVSYKTTNGTPVGNDAYGFGYILNGNKYTNTVQSAYGATFTTGDIIGTAFDADNGTLTFYKNGVSQGTAFTGLTSGPYFPAASVNTSSSSFTYNFGQQPFAYTPPTGYVALNTYNLPTSTIVKGNTVMDATLYTGNGSTQTITNAAGFKPDFVWGKMRASNGGIGEYHQLYDSIRGVEKALFSNATDAETNMSGGGVTAFNTNGFNVSATTNGININAKTYVGWQWQAGQGTTSTNTSGTITSTVSVNASAGFSVVTYTGTGGAPKTVGHGLGVAPSFIVVKQRNAVDNWVCYHSSLGATQYIYLNVTNAAGTASTMWDNTAPTSSVFTLGSNAATNGNGTTMVAYCWTPIAGYSAFGSYTGNGSTDGPFIYTGFRPKFLLTKRTDTAESWLIHDTTRNPSNVTSLRLRPNSSDAEIDAAYADILSNGFKLRVGGGGSGNDSGGSYIYAAFAENPFKNALAR